MIDNSTVSILYIDNLRVASLHAVRDNWSS